MSGDISCNDTDIGIFLSHTIGLRVYSIFFATAGHLAVVGFFLFWLYARRYLIYLKKRSTMSVIFISIAAFSMLHQGSVRRSFESTHEYLNRCLVFNVLFLSCLPLLLLGPLNTVYYFQWRASYSARIASIRENEKLQWWFVILNNPHFKSLQLFITLTSIMILIFAISRFLCKDCKYLSLNSLTWFIVVSLLMLILALHVVYIYRKHKTHPDPFDILSHLFRGLTMGAIFGFACSAIAVLVENLHVTTLEEGEDKRIAGGIFVDFGILFHYCYFVPYQIYLAFKFDEREALYSDITLKKVLDDKVGHDLLKKYLIFEFSVENLVFLDTLDDICKLAEEEQSHYLEKAYHDFIQSKMLNLSSGCYRDLEEAKKVKKLTLQSFTVAKEELLLLIEFDSFGRFKSSKHFAEYIGLAHSKQI